jgi:NTP pyrophosphatase (non-canonical NTP hydrolase)
MLLISDLTLMAIQTEATSAHAKHKQESMLYGDDDKSLRILVEEVGEVAKEMNELALGHITGEEYKERIVKELIQVAAMAATWIEKKEGKPRVRSSPRFGDDYADLRPGL